MLSVYVRNVLTRFYNSIIRLLKALWSELKQRIAREGILLPLVDYANWLSFWRIITGCIVPKLSKRGNSPPWVSEIILVLSLAIAIVWSHHFYSPIFSFLDEPGWRKAGAFVTAYLILQFLAFELHWLFVARTPLVGISRSLFTFLLNIPQMAIYFAIALELTGCVGPIQSIMPVFSETLVTTFKFELIKGAWLNTDGSQWCGLIPFAHFAVTKLLVGAIVIGLVRQIRRTGQQES